MDLDEPKLPPQLSKQLQSCQPLVQPSLVALLEQLMADVTTNSISNDSDVGDVTSVDSNDEAWNLQKRQQQQRRERRLAVVASLLRKDQLPARQRNKIEELVDDFDTKFSRDVHEMITDQHHDPAEYQGLDSNRDTHAEVETVLRLCPNAIKQTRPTVFNEDFDEDEEDSFEWVKAGDDDKYYPIQCLTWVQGLHTRDGDGYRAFNLKAIPFVHLFARLAIEFNSFDEDKRGGLMFADPDWGWKNILHLLSDEFQLTAEFDIEENGYMDKIRTTEYNRLRHMGLMVKDDIVENDLLSELCHYHDVFPEESAACIIEWCPESLLAESRKDGSRPGPFYAVAWHLAAPLQPFRFMFDYLIRYYPYTNIRQRLSVGQLIVGIIYPILKKNTKKEEETL